MSSVRRTAGVVGSFPATFLQPPVTAPTVAVYRDAARTDLAVAPTPLAPTANPAVWTASYPASLQAGRYFLAIAAVYTAGQSAQTDNAQELELVAAGVSVGQEAFATVADLAARTGKTYDAAQTAQLTTLLEDASAHLRDVIGAQVYPQADVDVVTRVSGCERIALPSGAVTVLQATVDGHALAPDQLHPDGCWLWRADDGWWSGRVVLRLRLGYASPPPELRRMAVVLATQAMALEDSTGQLGAAGGGSVQVDDFTYRWGGDVGEIPQRVQQRLRASYGSNAWVT